MKNFFDKIFFRSNNLESISQNIKNLTNKTPAHKIFNLLNSYSSDSEARYVGGCVRKIINKENVDDIGQGRVWSGSNAIDINLIDEYGGLEAAVAGAAELAELEDYRIYELPEQKDPFQELLEQLEEDMQTSWIKYQLGDQYKYYKTIQDIKYLKGVQARMPYQFVID